MMVVYDSSESGSENPFSDTRDDVFEMPMTFEQAETQDSQPNRRQREIGVGRSNSKRARLEQLEAHQVLYTSGHPGNYSIIQTYQALLSLITFTPEQDRFFQECIIKERPITLFFDIDAPKEPQNEENTNEGMTAKQAIIFVDSQVREYFRDKVEGELITKRIVLSSSTPIKESYHVIYRFALKVDDVETPLMFENVAVLKKMYRHLKFGKLKNVSGGALVDGQVYRPGLFRTVYSRKWPSGETPFTPVINTHNVDLVEAFVGYCPHDFILLNISEQEQVETQTTPTDVNGEEMEVIKQFVRSKFNISLSSITNVKRVGNVVYVSFKSETCLIKGGEHRSNGQYVQIDHHRASYRCYDQECEHKPSPMIVSRNDYPDTLLRIMAITLSSEQASQCVDYIKSEHDPGVIEYTYDEKENAIYSPITLHCRTTSFSPTKKHKLDETGYCVEKENVIVFKSKAIQPPPHIFGIFNNITINYLNANQQQEGDVFVPVGLFGDPELSEKWTNALNHCGDQSLSDLACHNVCELVYSGDNYFLYNTISGLWKREHKPLMTSTFLFERLSNHLLNLERRLGNEEMEMFEKKIRKIRDYVQGAKHQVSIAEIARSRMIDEEFGEKIDAKDNVIPFKNGVYDLDTGQFRALRRDDYVSTTVGYDFVEQPEVKSEVEQFVKSILPEDDLRAYVMRKCAECLDPRIANSSFIILVGTGANSKSLFLSLVLSAFGRLGTAMRATVLTRKEADPEQATPGLVKLKGKRFACITELEANGELNTSLLKKLTGSDALSARRLHEDEFTFESKAKFMMACNNPPTIDEPDEAVWRRVEVIRFSQKFVENPQAPNEHLIDPTLKAKMTQDTTWRQSFMLYMLDYLNVHVNKPESVKASTAEYRSRTDPFSDWLEDNVVSDPNGIIILSETVRAYLRHTGENASALPPRVLSRYTGRLTSYLSKHTSNGLLSTGQPVINGKRARGWVGFKII